MRLEIIIFKKNVLFVCRVFWKVGSFQIQSLHLIKDFFRQEHKVGRQQQKKYFLGDMSPIRGGGGATPPVKKVDLFQTKCKKY